MKNLTILVSIVLLALGLGLGFNYAEYHWLEWITYKRYNFMNIGIISIGIIIVSIFLFFVIKEYFGKSKGKSKTLEKENEE